jgi:hypothetical protein
MSPLPVSDRTFADDDNATDPHAPPAPQRAPDDADASHVGRPAETHDKGRSEVARWIEQSLLAADHRSDGAAARGDSARWWGDAIADSLAANVASQLPQDAPPALTQRAVLAAGQAAALSSPALASLTRQIDDARHQSNEALIAEGYNASALTQHTDQRATRTQTTQRPVDTTSLADPSPTSYVDPHTVIADVSGRDNSSVDQPLLRAYRNAYESAVRTGQSADQAHAKGMSTVLDGVLPLRANSPTLAVENKQYSFKAGQGLGTPSSEVRLSVPLFRLPAANANLGVTYTNNDTNVVNSDSALGGSVGYGAEQQRRNPVIGLGATALGALGAVVGLRRLGVGDTLDNVTAAATHTLGLWASGRSDSGRYDIARGSVTAANAEIRLGYNTDKQLFAKVQLEQSVEVQLFGMQAKTDGGSSSNFAALALKTALKSEPLSIDAKRGVRSGNPLSLSGQEIELTVGSKLESNALTHWTRSLNPDNVFNPSLAQSGSTSGATQISIGRDGSVFDLNDPAQHEQWRRQFDDVPLLLQTMRGSNKEASGSQLFLSNPRTYLNRGQEEYWEQTAHQYWPRPAVGTPLDAAQIARTEDDANDVNADVGDWLRGAVTKPFGWFARPADGRTELERRIEQPRENAGLPQGLKPIESTVAELNWVGAQHPRDLGALAHVTVEQLQTLNPDKVSTVERLRADTGERELVAAFKEGENLILPVASSRSGALVLLDRATSSSGEIIDVPAGATATTHVKRTPEHTYAQAVAVANGYNEAVQVLRERLADGAALTQAQSRLDAALASFDDDTGHLVTRSVSAQGVPNATVELGNDANTTPVSRLGDRDLAHWLAQQLLKQAGVRY